jgi:DNA-binding NtrC family response regulator
MDTNVRHPLRILVVEDEWVVRVVIANFLRDQGYMVVEAATGEEALSLLTGDNEPIGPVVHRRTTRWSIDRLGYRRNLQKHEAT